MEPTLDVGQRVLVNRFIYHFTDPKIGDIVVFHPPQGAEGGGVGGCGDPRTVRPRGLPRIARSEMCGAGRGEHRTVAGMASAAARLLRAYATQVETLRRLRNGNFQIVRVEHVHVNEGGQAIIGNVRSGTAGRAPFEQ